MTDDVSKRNKASKRRGAQFETDLLAYFRARGYVAERLSRTGVRDEGDLWVQLGPINRFAVVEAKNAARFTPSEWVEESITESGHFATARGLSGYVPPVVIAKRRNKPIEEAYVIQSLSHWLRTLGEPD